MPIALAYVAAHYLTLLLYQGQAIVRISWPPLGFLASNPLGEDGTDIFGTADEAIDYGVIGATTTWYCQVGFVVLGHVAALILAHDRALALYDDAKLAVRSQYWMLVVMVGLHEPRAVAAGAVERMIVLAHAGPLARAGRVLRAGARVPAVAGLYDREGAPARARGASLTPFLRPCSR